MRTSLLTIKSSLQAASSSIAPTSSTPATLGPGDALRALGELGALWRARVTPRKKTTALTCFTSQWHERWTHALEEGRQVLATNSFFLMNENTTEFYLLQSHTPHTVLPTPIRASGAQTKAASMKTVTRWGTRQRRRRLHLHR